jgi:hypothetical protein
LTLLTERKDAKINGMPAEVARLQSDKGRLEDLNASLQAEVSQLRHNPMHQHGLHMLAAREASTTQLMQA